MIIDKVNFDRGHFEVVLDYLTETSKKADPDHVGFKFEVCPPLLPLPPKARELHGIPLSLEDVPYSELISCICQFAHLDYYIEGNIIVFTPAKHG